MKKVIRIPEISGEKKEEKGIEFTHYLSGNSGWRTAHNKPNEYDQIIYLGNDVSEGDMFAAYDTINSILIYKGHLNNETY